MRVHVGPHLREPGTREYVGALERCHERVHHSFINVLPRALQHPPAGSCLHLKSICCARDDLRLLELMAKDIQAASYKRSGDALGFHRSRKHKVIYGEALSESQAFVRVVKHVLGLFDLTLVDCWANLYRGEDDMKSMHHDNYQDRTPRATVTMGVSLGQARHFTFQNPENGDIFAFDEPFNNLFKHAVPPEDEGTAPGKRIAIIIWANEQEVPASLHLTARLSQGSVLRMIRAKNPGMRDIVPLEVDWESWGKCCPGSLSRIGRQGDVEASLLDDYLNLAPEVEPQPVEPVLPKASPDVTRRWRSAPKDASQNPCLSQGYPLHRVTMDTSPLLHGTLMKAKPQQTFYRSLVFGVSFATKSEVHTEEAIPNSTSIYAQFGRCAKPTAEDPGRLLSAA
eukprot:s1397_g10.t1